VHRSRLIAEILVVTPMNKKKTTKKLVKKAVKVINEMADAMNAIPQEVLDKALGKDLVEWLNMMDD
jgi:hypothetical protein